MSAIDGETLTFTIETAGNRTELVVPRALVELFAAEGDTSTDVIADVAQFDLTRRIYEAAHLSEGETDADVTTIEADALACFEAHFGTSFEDVIGDALND
ncbi:MAG TPA: hypothetical protein VFJ06_15015 [Halococcus sp.]|nr:hypothetical protein [Halococcus sp.]